MNDAPDPQQELDELASAHLDGMTTPEEAARVAADPTLQARVAELGRIRAAVAQATPPVDDPEREAAIVAALAAFDEERGGTVVPLARGARRPNRALRYAAIAAAVVLAALVVPLLSRLDSGEQDDQAATFEETGAPFEAGADRDAADAAGGGTPEAGSTDHATALSALDLGAFAELAELEDAVRARLASVDRVTDDGAESAPTSTVTAHRSCPEPAAPSTGTVVLDVTATLDGVPVVVVVVDQPDGEQVLSVYDGSTCSPVAVGRL